MLIAPLLGEGGARAASCPAPAALVAETVRVVHRSALGFTQGLIYRNGFLYESVGNYGASGLNRIDPATGRVERLASLGPREFGEGLEEAGGTFFQLTWKEHEILAWDPSRFELSERILYRRDGWGLTHDPRGIWFASDGSSALHVFSRAPSGPEWVPLFDLPVQSEGRPQRSLNELEFARGAIFANVFLQNRILRVDPSSGCVTGVLQARSFAARAGEDPPGDRERVLNGIAYRPDTDTFYVTGKDWPVIFEVRIHDPK